MLVVLLDSAMVQHLPIIRFGTQDDAPNIVRLFTEQDNRHGWNVEKWRHYYLDYPEDRTITLLALVDGRIVGHYGMLPVKIGQYPALLGLHAYVSNQARSMTVIGELMKAVDRYCVGRNIALICGFANPRFGYIKKIMFRWHTLCWLGFVKDIPNARDLTEDRQFAFRYSERWFEWRFGHAASMYASRYVHPDGKEVTQLLKVRESASLATCNSVMEYWTPRAQFSEAPEYSFAQPFSIKVYDSVLVNQGIMDAGNWRIDMGDSDTFVYTPVQGY